MSHKSLVTFFTVLILLVTGRAFAAPEFALHASIRQFEEMKLLWKTENYLIRIDDIGNRNYRYAVWPRNSDQSEEPDLVLLHGIIVLDGTGGNHHYEFTNDEYSYWCTVNYITDGLQPPGTLRVFKDGKEILQEDVIEEIYNSMIDN